MATPVVAGVAALYLERDPDLTPAQLKALLLNDATPDILSGIGNDSPNLMLNTKGLQGEARLEDVQVAPEATESGTIDFDAYMDCTVPSIFFQKCTEGTRDPACCLNNCRFGRCMPIYF